MAVSNGQKVDAPVTNNAFVSRLQDSNTIGKVDVENTDTLSGVSVFNIQRALNSFASFMGGTIGMLKDAVPTWTTNLVGSASDNLQQRCEALTVAVDSNTTAIATITNWVKVTVNFSAISAAATTNTIVISTVPGKGILKGIILKNVLEFTGGSVSAITAELGISGESDRYTSAFDLLAVPTDSVFDDTTVSDLFDFVLGTDIELKVDSVGDNLDQLTQGDLEVYLFIEELPA